MIDYSKLKPGIYNGIIVYNEDGTEKLFNSGNFEKDYNDAFEYAMQQPQNKINPSSMSYIISEKNDSITV